MIGFSNIFSDPEIDMLFGDHAHIKEQQRIQSRKVLKELASAHLRSSERCSLQEIYDVLIRRGFDEQNLELVTCDIRDRLIIKIGTETFHIKHRMFPNQRDLQEISISVNDHEIDTSIPAASTPESIADLIQAIYDWIPEYCTIKENILAEEQQKKIARKIALDLLKRSVGDRLTEKGYDFEISGSEIYDNAQVKISVCKAFSMDLKVNLMEDFLDKILEVVDSLPDNR